MSWALLLFLCFHVSTSEWLQPPVAERLLSLLQLTVCLCLVWSVYFYSVLQLPSVSSAHFSDLELTAACLDIKQIQTLGAAAAESGAENHLENYHRSLDTSTFTVTPMLKQIFIWIAVMELHVLVDACEIPATHISTIKIISNWFFHIWIRLVFKWNKTLGKVPHSLKNELRIDPCLHLRNKMSNVSLKENLWLWCCQNQTREFRLMVLW